MGEIKWNEMKKIKRMKGSVLKETVVPCLWGSETQEFGSKQVGKSQIASAKGWRSLLSQLSAVLTHKRG